MKLETAGNANQHQPRDILQHHIPLTHLLVAKLCSSSGVILRLSTIDSTCVSAERRF